MISEIAQSQIDCAGDGVAGCPAAHGSDIHVEILRELTVTPIMLG
jgi:hypothetical protein